MKRVMREVGQGLALCGIKKTHFGTGEAKELRPQAGAVQESGHKVVLEDT